MGTDKQMDGQTEMGKTQGSKKMGYYLKNKPENLLKYYQIPTYLYSHSDPIGTSKQTNGQTQTNRQILTQNSGLSSHSLRGVWIVLCVWLLGCPSHLTLTYTLFCFNLSKLSLYAWKMLASSKPVMGVAKIAFDSK